MEDGRRLLLSLLGPDGARLWTRQADGSHRPLAVRPGDLELLVALAVPVAARRRAGTVGPRSREEVLEGLAAPPWARGVDLDARMGKDASTRSRRVASLRALLAGEGIPADEVLVGPAPGVLSLRGVAVDLVELVRCARAERWADGRELLALVAGDDAGAELRPPEAVTEPEALALVAEAVATIRAHPPEAEAEPEVAPAPTAPTAPQPARPARRPSGRRAVAGAALALALIGLGVVLGALLHTSRPPTRVAVAAAPAVRPVTLTVDNRVTEGTGMREDTSPVALTTRPVPYCGVLKCNVAGTERGSGGTYAGAVCRTSGSYVTNGNDSSAPDADDDDRNPALVRTTGYYGVRTASGTFGFVSEAWIVARQRGGLGLPPCPGDADVRARR